LTEVCTSGGAWWFNPKQRAQPYQSENWKTLGSKNLNLTILIPIKIVKFI